jgi:hypothetical protein
MIRIAKHAKSGKGEWMMDQSYFDSMQGTMTATTVPVLVVLGVLWVALAIGNGVIAARLGKSVVLWVILSLIPVVNYFFYVYIAYAVVSGVLRRLNAIADRVGAIV